MQKAHKPQVGFTLIEMLVVIAIIGILSSILMPSLRSALESSKSASCSSQLRQMGIATSMYSNDNNIFFPSVYWIIGSSQITWDDLLSNYDGRNLTDSQKNSQLINVSKQGIYRCPADERVKTYAIRSYAINKGYYSGYGTAPSDAPANIWGVASGSWSARLSNVKKPGLLITIADNSRDGNLLGNASCSQFSAPEDYYNYALALHNGNINFLLLDGHVQSSLPEATIQDGATLHKPGGLWARQ